MMCLVSSACGGGGDSDGGIDSGIDGGGDDGGGGTAPTCTISFDGDVTASEDCTQHVCFPIDGTYHSLSIARSTAPQVLYNISAQVASPMMFSTGSTYTIDQLRQESELRATYEDKVYVARMAPVGGTRDPAESATLTIETLTPPTTDPCNGSITGTLVVSMVEIDNLFDPTESVGPGRLTATVTLGN